MLGVKHTCQFTVGFVSSLMALGAGVSGLTMAMEGNHWPGVAMMVAALLAIAVAAVVAFAAVWKRRALR